MTLLAINRKRLQTDATYGILASVSRNALDGKVHGDDSNERAILHPRAGSRRATSINRYNYASHQSQEDKGFPGWEPMEDWRDRSRAVSRRAKQYPRPEINKATAGWQWTTKNLKAFRLSASVFQAVANNPSTLVPFFSIGNLGKFCQGLPKTENGVRVESVYVPMDNGIFSQYPKGIFCIYKFDDPRDNSVIYIGLTSNLERRVKEHLSKDGLLYPLAQELHSLGLQLSLSVIGSAPDMQQGRLLEKTWIQKTNPLLNFAHNIQAVYEKEREKERSQRLREYIEERGFTYKEAVLFVKHFHRSEGDHHNYAIIRDTTQIIRERLGLDPITEPGVLDIALEVCGLEQYRNEE